MFQSQFNLLIKKNTSESVSKIELVENNLKKFEYSISSVQHLDKAFNFLNAIPSPGNLQTINSN